MTRKEVLEAIKAAGARGDNAAFVRLYVENRITISAARKAFADDQLFGAFVRSRDEAKREKHPPACEECGIHPGDPRICPGCLAYREHQS